MMGRTDSGKDGNGRRKEDEIEREQGISVVATLSSLEEFRLGKSAATTAPSR